MGSSKGLALTVLALTLLAASACDRKASKDAKGAAPPPPPTVIVTQVEQRTVPIVRDFVARTEAIPTVEIRARVAAVLEKVLYREGTLVKQGQVLFELQREEYAALLGAMSDADFRASITMFGQDMSRGSFIVNMVLSGCAAYRTQLFIYLKACGRHELGTMNLWAGADAPA